MFDSVVVGDVDGLDESKQDDNTSDEANLTDTDSSNEDQNEEASGRSGRGRRVFPKCLPREERIRELTDEDIPEDLRGTDLRGTGFRRFLKKIGEWMEYEPPTLTVI